MDGCTTTVDLDFDIHVGQRLLTSPPWLNEASMPNPEVKFRVP
jgi:hypothetical protein